MPSGDNNIDSGSVVHVDVGCTTYPVPVTDVGKPSSPDVGIGGTGICPQP